MKNSSKVEPNHTLSRINPRIHLSGLVEDTHAIEIRLREAPTELESRLRIQEADANHDRRKDTILFSITLIIATLLILICLIVILLPASSPANISWAKSMLTLLMTGICGYLFGLASNKKRSL